MNNLFKPYFMRKHFFTVSCLALLLFTACSKDEVKYPSLEGDETLNIAPFVTFNASKLGYDNAASSSAFISGEEISVSAWTGSIEKDENFIARNSIYKCGDNGLFLPATENDTLKWKDVSTPHYFIATYPKRSELADLRSLPVTSGDKDMYVARCLGSEGGAMPYVEDTVALSFRHILAKINVSVAFDEKIDESEIPLPDKCKLYFEDASEAGYLDLVTLNLTSETKDDIYFEKVGGYSFTGTLIPQEISNVKLKVEDSGEADFTYIGELNFESGKEYDLTFSVEKRNKLVLQSVTVKDWGNGGLTLFEGTKGSWRDKSSEIQINEKVYEVTTGGELYYALTNVGKGQTVRLMNDIDLEAHYWEPVTTADGTSWTNYITIDGNNKKITGLRIDASQYDGEQASLIGTAKYTMIKDLTVVNPEIIGDNDVTNCGVLLSNASNGVGVFNCVVKGAKISGNFNTAAVVGGIAGGIFGGSAVAGCVFEGSINTSSNVTSVGGLVGKAGPSMVVASYSNFSTSSLNATNKGLFVGGKGGSAATKSAITGCIYIGDLKYKPVGQQHATMVVTGCDYGSNNLSLSALNNAINGTQGYAGANDENGPSGSTNIMLSNKDDYKYNFIENTGADTGTYKYVVVNTAEQ